MKNLLFFSLLFLSSLIAYSQKKEMAENFRNGDYDKTIEIGKKILEAEPDDFETILFIAKAQNEKGNFADAAPYLASAKKLAKEGWQKSWMLLETARNSFGTGNIQETRMHYKEALAVSGTKNSAKELKSFGMLSGLDDFYKDWKIRESKNIIFHFEGNISIQEIERIVKTRQEAFDEVNSFFNSAMLKKIDFFVWNLEQSFNPALNANLGFSCPALGISHNRLGQTPGHEIAHNISFWKSKSGLTTKFINEGIGVCFDQQKNDKMKIAQEIYKNNPIDIKEIWKSQAKLSDGILYPISGAFVELLVEYDKEKFFKLNENQTYENALKVYGREIDELIEGFTLNLKQIR